MTQHVTHLTRLPAGPAPAARPTWPAALAGPLRAAWLLALLLASGFAARAQTMAAGNGFSFALHADGTLWGSGYNPNGQLGDGTGTNRSQAVKIGALATWQSLASGNFHTEAIRADGTLWAWGRNDHGELGDGTSTNRNTPVQVGTATTWARVAVGMFHTLALRTDGTLWAWGYNNFGQIGNGTTTNQSTPLEVGAGAVWVAVAAGSGHSLALRADGTLWAWGQNGDRQLGDGTTTQRLSMVQVGTANTWASVATGPGALHSIGIRTDGTLWTWGRNVNNQLGDGTSTPRSVPTQVGTATTWQSASAGAISTLALRTDGTLWAWGNNDYGQLGDGTTTNRPAPVQVGTATTWQRVAAGFNQALAQQADGTIYAWGWNSYGQLGAATAPVPVVPSPTQVGTATTWAATVAGSDFTLGLTNGSALWSWGENISGQLGQGSALKAVLPSPALTSAASWASVAAGSRHVLGIRPDGTLWAWGSNGAGQLGQGTSYNNPPVPTPVPVGSATWQSATAGNDYSLGIQADGTLWAWGQNNQGQLGTGTTATQLVPVQIGTDTWRSVAAGGNHTLAVRTDGTLWAWGNNAYGQLGTGTTATQLAPVQIGSATDWATVTTGLYHSAATRTDGTLWAWGYNGNTQLGDGTTTQRTTPVQVGTATTWQRVAAGASFTLALRTDGSLWATGSNLYGQLGDGTFTNRSAYAQVGTATWQGISTQAYAYHVAALRADGTLWAWGFNNYGQLSSPITVLAPLLLYTPPATPLPVGLAAFTATAEGPTTVALAWTTASEKNSARFEVERSREGVWFERIGTVAAAGSSSSARSYELLDNQVPRTPSPQDPIYYRLRQVDTDGSFSYSPVRTVALTGAAAGLALFPNPATTGATLTGALPGTLVTVFDALGRRVTAAPADATGTAALALPAGQPAGVYVVRAGNKAVRLTVD